MISRVSTAAAAAALLLAGAGPAAAQMVFQPVTFAAQPSAAELAQAYPEGQTRAGFQAFGCRIGPDGRLVRCKPVMDPNIGGPAFEAAATEVLPLYRVAPGAPGGMAEQGLYVEAPVYLTPPGGKPVAAPRGRAPEAMVFRQAEWTSVPSDESLAAEYPGGRDGPSLVVNFTCIVGPAGELKDCVVHRNSYDAPGRFVATARRFLPLYRVETITAGGVNTPGMNINFAVPLFNPSQPPPRIFPPPK